ncbi:MAG TPA: RimK family protein [Gammaproteobacteria bacterium]|nr:RimK family protein [Gammaproteobacteria bacterium]
MSKHIIVVENPADWRPEFPPCTVMSAREYLATPETDDKNVRVINLCRSYGYLSTGYYVSLLAEARRTHKAIPSVRTISDLSRKALYSLEAGDIDELVGKRLRDSPSDTFEMCIFLGRHADDRLQEISRQIFDLFPCPMLRVEFRREAKAKWRISRIRPLALHQLDDVQRAHFGAAVQSYLNRPWRSPRARASSRYDLAILYNPDDPLPPSDRKALKNFERVGRRLGIDVELIERRDYTRLAEYDALFIRDTTRIDHYTYRFAKKAQSEGMVVIDDPDSILKCTNKVYMAELLRAAKIPHPRTVILQKGQLGSLEEEIPYPIVLKIPDGSFSRGVFKVNDRAELAAVTERLFKESDLILAQEFIYTEYDWRIGVLNRRPLFACQYFMSKDHWQILNHKARGRQVEGEYRTLPVQEVPAKVIKMALKAANLIGDGLYGVDLKQNDRGVFVIEINDNPNIESGVEDAFLKDDLYRLILEEFVARLERRRH